MFKLYKFITPLLILLKGLLLTTDALIPFFLTLPASIPEVLLPKSLCDT